MRGKSKGYVMVAAVYLLGLFIGALDMGIVTPARTVIQNSMGVEDSLGVWMLTIYTLAYAASIPIMGKLADKYGRKYIYLLCVTLFGLGSLMCGLSREFNSFEMLLFARAVQAIGGGGIMPVATAEFGTAFPGGETRHGARPRRRRVRYRQRVRGPRQAAPSSICSGRRTGSSSSTSTSPSACSSSSRGSRSSRTPKKPTFARSISSASS